jgi:CRISPR system Cascade subunit CasE
MSDTGTSLYLSRLLLDPNCRQVRSELAHPYEMHRTVMHAFDRYSVSDGERKREKFNVLFRADEDDLNGHVILYVQSTVEPDWVYLCEKDGYLVENTNQPNPACKNVEALYQNLCKGQELSFYLRANPTKRIAKPKRGDDSLIGKRVALLHEEEQMAWLIRKGQEREAGCPGGFEILTKQITQEHGKAGQIVLVHAAPEGKQIGLKRDEKRDYRMTHLAVRYNGLLRITNTDDFRNTIVRGLGSGKAFGFGLLSVRKVTPNPSAVASCSSSALKIGEQ